MNDLIDMEPEEDVVPSTKSFIQKKFDEVEQASKPTFFGLSDSSTKPREGAISPLETIGAP